MEATMELDSMVGEIGLVAGKIWACLKEEAEEVSFSDLKAELGETPAMVQLAVGWLAREGKVEIRKQGAGYRVRLTD